MSRFVGSDGTPEMNEPIRRLTLLDSTCMIVGIIIGSGIYRTTPEIARQVAGPGQLMLIWALGGLLTLVGSLCYAELTTAFPRAGGDYHYLSRAYGAPFGFVFAWSEFWVIRPGNVGMVAFVMADYAQRLWPLRAGDHSTVWYAGGAVVVMGMMNLLGVSIGKWIQNVLTIAKVGGLLAICAVGLLLPASPPTGEPVAASATNFQLALVFALFAFGGWNEMSYVAAEVRDPSRNLLRALVLGALVVTGTYLLANLAFLRLLGFQGVRSAQALAADVLEPRLGAFAARASSLLVCVSCLGALNGMLFTGPRIYYALGRDYPFFHWLGRWNDRLGGPARALTIQTLVTVVLIVVWGRDRQGFERLLAFTTPIYWSFIFFVAISILVLRFKEPAVPRPYRVVLYPITPLVFAACCALLVYSGISYARAIQAYPAAWAAAILAAGVGISLVQTGYRKKDT